MNTPFSVNLSDKVIAVTGAGGVLCSAFAKALAANGAKVALLDINEAAVKAVAEEIGENALAVPCNCLDKASIEAAKATINETWGKVNFLVNGAGGNNPKASTDNEQMTPDLTGVNTKVRAAISSQTHFTLSVTVSGSAEVWETAGRKPGSCRRTIPTLSWRSSVRSWDFAELWR